MSDFGILRFHERYFERIWGGQRLRTLYGKPIPADRPVGEAWLVSDHPSAVSVVSEGPHAGRTLHELVEEDAESLLGSRAKLTPHGRFPLLLKLLDSTDVLSVQVHPDDATAAALGEPDIGKTEMWHVLHADPGAELFCGLQQGVTLDQVQSAIETGTLERHLARFNVKQGDSVYVPAGTVHAIGAGIVLAEIQQNSDLTYRLHDWGRVDASGKPRELHIEKALRATHFSAEKGMGKIINNEAFGIDRRYEVLIDDEYFSVSLISVDGPTVLIANNAFTILLCISGSIDVSVGTYSVVVETGQCCLVPACVRELLIDGKGTALEYCT